MGQYYHALIKTGEKTAFSTYVDGVYMLAKLLEHSWWANPYVLAVASKSYKKKVQLAWVGDYADADDFNWHEDFSCAWNDNASNRLKYNGFRLEGKFLVNHTKKMLIDLDRYFKLLSAKSDEEDCMVLNPLSLLTAVGNGKGGGDFHDGIGCDLIGSWAWDIIEINDDYDEKIFKYSFDGTKWVREFTNAFSDYHDVTEAYLFREA